MNLLWFSLFGISMFMCTLIGFKKYHNTTLYALAIGGVVNSNLLTAYTYPIDIFGLSFGIDSIIYTLFVYCVVLMYLKEGKKSAYLLGISSIIAIMFSALMQFVGDSLSDKVISFDTLNTFGYFIIASFSSLVAIICMLEALDRFKKFKLFNNPYVVSIVGIIICTFVNFSIYYGTIVLFIGRTGTYLWELLLTSYLGKTYALLCSIIALYFYFKIKKRNESKEIKRDLQ